MKNYYFNTYTSLDTADFVNTFIKSLLASLNSEEHAHGWLNLNLIHFDDYDNKKEIYDFAERIYSQSCNRLMIEVTIVRTSIKEISKRFGISQDEMQKARKDQENENLTINSYKFKMACSAYIRYQRLNNDYIYANEMNKSLGKTIRYQAFIHADIDTFFTDRFIKSIEPALKYDVSVYLRESAAKERGKIYGGFIMTKFNSSNPQNTIFGYHKNELSKINPAEWPQGYGQYSLYKAYQQLQSSGNNNIFDLRGIFEGANATILRGNRGGRTQTQGDGTNKRKVRLEKREVYEYFQERLKASHGLNKKVLSRNNPSKIYGFLHDEYLEMHSREEIYDTPQEKPQPFSGKKICQVAPALEVLNKLVNCKSLLDYGGGKGTQYSERIAFASNKSKEMIRGLHTLLKIERENVYLYDPASSDKNDELPKADMVISSDALEHLHEDDVIWAINEIFSNALKAVFISVPTYLDNKTLPSGLPCHMTVKSHEWWFGVIKACASNYPNIKYLCLARDKKGINLYSNIISHCDHLGNVQYAKKVDDFPKMKMYGIYIDGEYHKSTYIFNE